MILVWEVAFRGDFLGGSGFFRGGLYGLGLYLVVRLFREVFKCCLNISKSFNGFCKFWRKVVIW